MRVNLSLGVCWGDYMFEEYERAKNVDGVCNVLVFKWMNYPAYARHNSRGYGTTYIESGIQFIS
jgi:hypothetical protein